MLRRLDVALLGHDQELEGCVYSMGFSHQPDFANLPDLPGHCAADDPSLAAHLFSTFSFTRGLGALLCAPIASALISRPFSAASPRTAYGAANGEYGGIVLFAGMALAAGAGLEGVEWLLAL